MTVVRVKVGGMCGREFNVCLGGQLDAVIGLGRSDAYRPWRFRSEPTVTGTLTIEYYGKTDNGKQRE